MSPTFWEAASAACGVIYFTAWSASFYPQIFLNYRRKTAQGLSPDFTLVNPIGFFCLSVWSWGAFFSKTARRQYADRHDGHLPQVSVSDLAFSLHALILSFITFIQSAWYFHQARLARTRPVIGEANPLLPRETDFEDAPTGPSMPTRALLAVLAVLSLWQITSLVLGRTQLLDFLYFASTVKLSITLIKYVPQVFLNYKLKSVRGFAISTVFCDITGGCFSLLQLVISSVFIDHAPSGIWANPGKLGLALFTLMFDFIFIIQRYALYPEGSTDVDADEDL